MIYNMRTITSLLLATALAFAQSGPKLSPQQQTILDRIKTLRSLSDSDRRVTTRKLAFGIRDLPANTVRVQLATSLANLSTEGDFGHDTLQAVATTLATALAATPLPDDKGKPAQPYLELASLIRYEHATTDLKIPQLEAARHQLEADDLVRASATLTLTDLHGKTWSLADLRGKVVLLNFWATWCPPCRKEMPDLDALFHQFKKQGLVVLAISDEEEAKVKPFVAARQFKFPILLDPGRKVNSMFRIEGIPKSFVYDREGKLVAQSIDMRTRKQFLEMLAAAGLK
jgi:peroxiredoxin